MYTEGRTICYHDPEVFRRLGFGISSSPLSFLLVGGGFSACALAGISTAALAATGLATFFLTTIPLSTRLPSGFLVEVFAGLGGAGAGAEGVNEGGGFPEALLRAATALTHRQ